MTERAYLPIDDEAERAVLAAALTSPEAFYDIRELLTPDDFGIEVHRYVYAAMVDVDNAGRPVDQITVVDELRRAKNLKRVGGSDGVATVAAHAAEVDNLGAHTDIVAEKSLLRRLVIAGRQISGAALSPEHTGTEALELAEQAVFDLGAKRQGSSLTTMPQAIADTMRELAKVRTKLLLGHSTGLSDLDRLTGGLQPGQLVVVAARPAMGKSAFALQMARSISEQGLLVPFLSYEMSVTEITMRLLATSLGYDLHKLRQGQLPPDDGERKLAVAGEKLATLPLLIDDNPPTTIGGVRSAMRRLARRGEIGAIFVDYLQLLEGDGRYRDGNRVQEIAVISRGLKRLASELAVPVVALSQLSRAVEQRVGNKRPVLSDLRESGSIEQDASIVAFLYRDSVYNPDAEADLAECIVAKQRNGPTGTVWMGFDAHCARFVDTDRRGTPGVGALAGSAGRGPRPAASDPF
jgi:replicative DNA helicase